MFLFFPLLQYLKLKTKAITVDEIEIRSAENKNFYSLGLRGLPYKIKKKDIKEFFRPLKVDSIRIPPKIKGIAYVGFKNEKDIKKALVKNKSFISKFTNVCVCMDLFSFVFVIYNRNYLVSHYSINTREAFIKH